MSNQIRTSVLRPLGGRRRLTAGLFGLVAAGGLPVPGWGQEAPEGPIDSPYRWIEPRVRLGLFGAYFAANRGNLDFGPGPTPEFGSRFRVRVSSPLSLELGISYGPASRWVIDPRVETGPAVIDSVASHWLLPMAGVQLGLTGARTWHGIHPYVVLGGGLRIGIKDEKSDRLVPEGGGEEEADPTEPDPLVESLRYTQGSAWSIYGGLGIEIFPSDRIGFSLEARDIILKLKPPDGWFEFSILETIEEAGAVAPKESQWTHNFEFSLTLWYYF